MNREVALRETPAKEMQVGQRGLIVQNVSDLKELAMAVIAGEIAPKGMTLPVAMAVMAYGMEIGLTPMQSLSAICFINGKATVYGDGITALLHSSGKLADMGEPIYSGEGDNRRCTVTLVRKGLASPIVRSFSIGDARLAGLLGRVTWKTYPERMLLWRALGWAARDGFSDVLKGIWTREEAEDMGTPVDALVTRSEPLKDPSETSHPEVTEEVAKSAVGDSFPHSPTQLPAENPPPSTTEPPVHGESSGPGLDLKEERTKLWDLALNVNAVGPDGVDRDEDSQKAFAELTIGNYSAFEGKDGKQVAGFTDPWKIKKPKWIQTTRHRIEEELKKRTKATHALNLSPPQREPGEEG